jgi:hypothetical protein
VILQILVHCWLVRIIKQKIKVYYKREPYRVIVLDVSSWGGEK